MWFKNLKLFRVDPTWAPSADELETALERLAYAPASSHDMQTLGWVPPRDEGGLVHALDGHFLLSLRNERKLLPTTVIRQVALAKAQEIEEQQGYKPGRRQMKEIREQVADELLPRAFSVYRDTRVWIDMHEHRLLLDAAAAAKCDEVLGALAKCLDAFPVRPIMTELSPASAMTAWLLDDEAPAGFSIDQDTELRATNESRSAVRYVRQSVELDEVRKHVEAGKQCTKLALTWADRVSFVLNEGLDIRRVSPLDVLTENQDNIGQNDAERFDSDMALMAGELSGLITDLTGALGGEKA